MIKILKVKNIPVVGWSSDNPLNFRPRFRTILWLTIGLLLFGAGETLMIAANAGVSPWTVFAQGISETLKISIGMATFYTGVNVLGTRVPLFRKRVSIHAEQLRSHHSCMRLDPFGNQHFYKHLYIQIAGQQSDRVWRSGFSYGKSDREYSVWVVRMGSGD